MDRRDFIKSLGFGAASLVAGGCSDSYGAKKLFSSQAVDVQMTTQKTNAQPNIVFILTDDQGYGDLACLGNPIIKTPKIDELYRQSTRLTDYHVGPTCSPTRAGLMTGRYCNRTGVWHTIMGRSLLRKDEVTMADVFKSAGYKTGIFGKWHLGDNYPFRPQDRGFDEVLVNGGGGITQTPDYWTNDYFDDTYYHNGTPQQYTGYCTDVWFNNAMNFITANKDNQFFCYIPTNAPHAPTNIESKYSQPYSGSVAQFYGMIANIDENVGKLNAHLKNLGLDQNTILIFMTDNGTAGGQSVYNAGMRGTKASPYDGGHRVPFFIRWPNGGIPAGKDVNMLTAHVDILPTLIDLCQISNAPEVQFDGTSIKSLIYGTDAGWPDRVIVTDNQRVENPVKWKQCATMMDQWRLVNNGNGDELYNIKTDPDQNNNIASSNPSVVSNLRNEYEQWWASVSARFNEYCRIIIGNDAENPVRLTGHDGHPDDGANLPHDQGRVRSGGDYDYFWAVDIEQDGEYEFELRRWPAEANLAIKADCPAGGPVPGGSPYAAGVALNIVTAGLNIANINVSKAVNDGDLGATFRATLSAGPAELRAWFTDSGGKTRSAYYVYAKRL